MTQTVDLLRQLLEFLLVQEALESGTQKFKTKKEIEEIRAKLHALGADSATRPDRPTLPRSASIHIPPRPPAPPERCFGRDVEVETLVSALCADPPSPTSLLGGPGMGKSTILRKALHDGRVVRHFGPKRYFVQLRQANTWEALVQALANGIGIAVEAGRGNPVDWILAALEDGRAALVLDNLETSWWEMQEEVEELLAQLRELPALALAVSLRGGRRPLKVRWGETIEVGVLLPGDARKMFLDIAGNRFEGDPHLDDLLTVVDYMPLAVELLAQHAECERDLAGFRRRWPQETVKLLRVTEEDNRFFDSLERSIQSRRMTRAARRLLTLLGVLPDGIALDDLTAVLEEGDAAAGCLRQLGLAAGWDKRRLQLLAPVREQIAQRYEPDREDISRAQTHYLNIAAFGTQKNSARAFARLSPELNNLKVMISRELEKKEAGAAIDLAIALGELFCATEPGRTVLPGLLEGAANAARKAGDGEREGNCIKWLSDMALAAAGPPSNVATTNKHSTSDGAEPTSDKPAALR